MNFAAAIAIAAGAIAVYVGLMARRFAAAPGWSEQRWFSLIAVGAAAYAFGNVATSLGLSDATVVAFSRVQIAAVLVQMWAWLRYVDAYLGRHPTRGERGAVALLLALAVLALVPGVVFDGTVIGHAVPGFSSAYRDAVLTPFGEVLIAVSVGPSALILARLVAAWRRGLPHAALHAASFAVLLSFGINDGLVAAFVFPGFYLLDIGFVIPIGALAYSLTQRFVQDARALHALRDRLEALVEARTSELAETQEALHQAEKLASLGQFAAGVAHEVNNPASVVTSSLSYLEEGLASGSLPADAHDTTIEALSAMQRINGLVRRLVDAGRLASVPVVGGTASVRGVIEQAFDDARARNGERVAFRVAGSPDLHAGVRPEVLSQVLSALLYNAAEAIPEGRTGQVAVTTQPAEDGRILLEVTDDGAGMAPEVLRRAFEPFFSTKGEGKGSGLGLPVARALVESLGGELRLESRLGLGTTATLTLPEAPPPA
jgi:signal transduction histidine kinase